MTTTDPTATAPQPATPGDPPELYVVLPDSDSDLTTTSLAEAQELAAALSSDGHRYRAYRLVPQDGPTVYQPGETYELPAEPPDTYVYSLWDCHGCRWTRHAAAGHWELAKAAPNPGHGYWHVAPESIAPWRMLVAEFGPLSTTPPAGTEPDENGGPYFVTTTEETTE